MLVFFGFANFLTVKDAMYALQVAAWRLGSKLCCECFHVTPTQTSVGAPCTRHVTAVTWVFLLLCELPHVQQKGASRQKIVSMCGSLLVCLLSSEHPAPNLSLWHVGNTAQLVMIHSKPPLRIFSRML